MIIDIHTHVFPDRIAASALAQLSAKSHTRPFSDATAEGLRASMARAGIAHSVVQPVATRPDQTAHINDASIRLHRTAEATGVDSFGAMHPDCEGWRDELGRLAAAGVKGIKLHPVYQQVDFDDPRTLRILTRAGELGLTVLVHAGLDVGFPGAEQVTPAKVLRAVRKAGPVRLILAHMGGWRCWDEVGEVLAGTGALIDTAFSLGRMTPSGDGHPWTDEDLTLLSPGAFVQLARRFGADRVLFGSDSPWADQEQALAAFLALPFTEAEREAILYANAVRILGL